VIEQVLTHLDAKGAAPEASLRAPCRAPARRGLFECASPPGNTTHGCGAGGAASVAAGLTAGAAGKSAPAHGWLDGFGPLERRSEPLGRSDRRAADGADEREEVIPAHEKRVYIAHTQQSPYSSLSAVTRARK